jgi:hypothetical protein
MTKASDSPETKLPGIWSPQELATTVSYSRQTIIDAINGKGKYPRRLYAQKVGKLWLIPDSHAETFLHWHRTGELLDEPPIPEKLFWSIEEIAIASGMSRIQVGRAVAGVKADKGKYSYEPIIPGHRFGQAWLVKPEDAQKYINDKRRKTGRGS